MNKPGDRMIGIGTMSIDDMTGYANGVERKTLEAIKCPTGYCGDDEGGECPACLGTGILWREVVDGEAKSQRR